jgi:prophage regulatory protein
MELPMTASRRESSSPAAVVDTVDRLIDMKQLEPMVCLKRSAINERVKEGSFVQPVRLSARCTRFRLSEVQAWIAAQGKPL